MYDLLLKGATVVDPSRGLRGALDVAIERGAIATVAAAIPAQEARRVIEVPGTIVTPGLIDLQAKGFQGFTRFSGNPDQGSA
jgi:dihydroorotase